jgi:hypothetical protein
MTKVFHINNIIIVNYYNIFYHTKITIINIKWILGMTLVSSPIMGRGGKASKPAPFRLDPLKSV